MQRDTNETLDLLRGHDDDDGGGGCKSDSTRYFHCAVAISPTGALGYPRGNKVTAASLQWPVPMLAK